MKVLNNRSGMQSEIDSDLYFLSSILLFYTLLFLSLLHWNIGFILCCGSEKFGKGEKESKKVATNCVLFEWIT